MKARFSSLAPCRRAAESAVLAALTFAAAIAISVAPAQADEPVKAVPTPPSSQPNHYYVGARPPLLLNPLVKLPVGSIRPEGWLREQLTLMADGFTGHLPELSQWCQFEGSAWISPTGEGKFGWEELPYWLKGFTDLGYVLGDQRIIGEAKRWIDAILAGQRADGYFGSKDNLDALDIWPNMAALYALRTYYEATGDDRILTFMSRYFKWLTTVPREKLLPGSWQKIRGGDNLESIYWLYNHTGEKWLLDLATTNHDRTADWTVAIPTWHGVNLTQGFREPAEFYQQSHEPRHLNATIRNYDVIMERYGQVPGGMFGADENAREGRTGPRQAAETCSMVEFMYSDEMLTSITGDPIWADRCEEIAFNSLPASMTPDLKGLHYLTSPNLIQLDRKNKAPMVENDGDMFSYNPADYRCCQHNVAFGWPYFSEHLWMATTGNGLAAVLYAPSAVTAKVGSGAEVRFTETTSYPFDETVTFTCSTKKTTRFPFYLRIPNWCKQPKLTVNGQAQTVPPTPKGWLVVNRAWKDGDRVQLELPMSLEVSVWVKNRYAVSVSRGPLTYSLKIGERWQRYGGTDRWPAFEVFPTTPWNYGLIVDVKNPAASLEVVKSQAPLPAQPFTVDHAPISLVGKGKRIPQWKQEANGLIGELRPGPFVSDEPEETIILIPMGCARLRVSAFPQIGLPPIAHAWR